jgi:hypothetical protein
MKMFYRNRIAPALLATLFAVVSPLGSLADLSNLNRFDRFHAQPIVSAYLPAPFVVGAATSSLRQSRMSACTKQGPVHALPGTLHRQTLVPRRDRLFDFNPPQQWQPQNISVVCDRAPPRFIFG